MGLRVVWMCSLHVVNRNLYHPLNRVLQRLFILVGSLAAPTRVDGFCTVQNPAIPWSFIRVLMNRPFWGYTLTIGKWKPSPILKLNPADTATSASAFGCSIPILKSAAFVSLNGAYSGKLPQDQVIPLLSG